MGSDLLVDIDAQPESTTRHPMTASARPRKEVIFFMGIEDGAVAYDLGFGAKNEYASSMPPSISCGRHSSMYVIWLGPLGQMWVANGLPGWKAIQTAGALHQVERRLQIQALGRSTQGSGGRRCSKLQQPMRAFRRPRPFERGKILQPSNHSHPTLPVVFSRRTTDGISVCS